MQVVWLSYKFTFVFFFRNNESMLKIVFGLSLLLSFRARVLHIQKRAGFRSRDCVMTMLHMYKGS